MNKLASLIIILAIIVVVIGIIFVVTANRGAETVTTEVITTPIPTPTATATPTPSETPVATVSVDTITLVDVANGDSYGEATREFTDGKFTHTVSATLPSLGEGEFYEGWLVKADNSEFFSTGKMTKSGDKYTLTYTDNVDPDDFSQVVITLEKTEDETPERHILEGSFSRQLLF